MSNCSLHFKYQSVKLRTFIYLPCLVSTSPYLFESKFGENTSTLRYTNYNIQTQNTCAINNYHNNRS